MKTQHLLKTAVDAKIPLIAVKSDDPRYAPVMISAITKRKPEIIRWRPKKDRLTNREMAPAIENLMNPGQFSVVLWQDGLDWHDIGVWLEKNESTLVVINPETLDPWMMDVGTISVPPKVVQEFVKEYSDGSKDTMLVAALAGLSYTNMVRISKMAMARFGEFTPKAVRAIRKEFFQTTRGLEEIESDQLFYFAPGRLAEWLKVEGKLFKPDTHPLLTPRGFMFRGKPGTGKTSGAKYLAAQLGVPLYKLDMGMVLSKWVGQSDERLKAALQQADSFEPCVLLIDEVEKLFEMADTSGVMPRLLGYLLWWLQERVTKVLVVMTTNDESKIPPELYRPGRVDEVVEFTGLLQTQIVQFVHDLGKKLQPIAKVPASELDAMATEMQPDAGEFFTQARVTEAVLRLVKLKVINQSGEHSG